jgi:hypothetical protein
MSAKIYQICEHKNFKKLQCKCKEKYDFKGEKIDFSAADYVDFAAYEKYRIDLKQTEFKKQEMKEIVWTGDKTIY